VWWWGEQNGSCRVNAPHQPALRAIPQHTTMVAFLQHLPRQCLYPSLLFRTLCRCIFAFLDWPQLRVVRVQHISYNNTRNPTQTATYVIVLYCERVSIRSQTCHCTSPEPFEAIIDSLHVLGLHMAPRSAYRNRSTNRDRSAYRETSCLFSVHLRHS
jgi:hypothetical protein